MEGFGSPKSEYARTCRTRTFASVDVKAGLMGESCRASRACTSSQLSRRAPILHCAHVRETEVRVPVRRSHAAAAPKTAVRVEDPVSRELAVGARAFENCA